MKQVERCRLGEGGVERLGGMFGGWEGRWVGRLGGWVGW